MEGSCPVAGFQNPLELSSYNHGFYTLEAEAGNN